MAESISQVKSSIEKRLKELRAEQSALESALTALGGVTTRGRRAAGRTRQRATTTARRTRRRGKRGSRSAQALALVKAQPGITIPAMAKEMGIAAPYLYRVLPKLAEEGKVRKDGSGWHPAKKG